MLHFLSHVAAVGMVLLSAGMIFVVALRCRQRIGEGFVPGAQVRQCPISEKEMVLVVGVLLLLYGQMILLGEMLRRLNLLDSVERKVLFVVLSSTVFYALFLSLLAWLLHRNRTTWSAAFGLRASGSGNVVLTAVVSLLAVMIPLLILGWVSRFLLRWLDWPIELQQIIQLFQRISDPGLILELGFLAVAGAPVTEELFFRGLIYPVLKRRFGFVRAIGISSILFSLCHFHAPSILPLFGLSVVLTLLYEWRGNLAACMALHSLFNTLSLSLLFLLKNDVL